MRNIEHYEKDYIADGFEFYQAKYRKKKVLEIVNANPHKSILEIGCGMDPLFNYIDDFDNYVFFEPGKYFYENAKKLTNDDKRISGYCDDFVADSRTIGIHFDMIICSSLLHELKNPSSMLKDIAFISDDSTIVHINVPNANSFHRILAKEMGLISDVHVFSKQNIKFQQNNVFDKDSLEKIAKDEGFEVIAGGGYFLKSFTHSQMHSIIKQGIINENVLDGLYNITPQIENFASEIYINCIYRPT